MKTIIALSMFGVCQIVIFSCYAQGQFQNLNFESAVTTPIVGSPFYPYAVTTANALPGWSVFYGTIQQTQMFYNSVSLGSSQVTLVGANDPFGPNAIEGNFGVLLQGGSTATDVSIRQSSMVPVLTESILFKAQAEGPMSLSLGGQDISFAEISTGANYTLYGGNIPSALAGQIEQLEFSVPEAPGGNNGWNLDSIMFSPNIIPEPSTWTLMLCGAVLFGIARYANPKPKF